MGTPEVSGPNQITSQDVLKDTGLDKAAVNLKEPSLTSRGMKLLVGVGSLAILLTVLIIVRWMLSAPAMPISANTTVADAASVIKNYKDLSDIALDSATRMFDIFVVKALLPVFTTILGYVFGTRNASGERT
jgi:hypothetical protein